MAPLLLWGLPDQEALRLLIMGIGSGVIGVGVSLLTGPEDHNRLEIFYRRAQPPGFWGPIERRVYPEHHDSSQRFWRAILAMGFTSLSILCVLTGIGSWMVGSPVPVGGLWREGWIAGLLLIGVILCPIWIRIGFRTATQ